MVASSCEVKRWREELGGHSCILITPSIFYSCMNANLCKTYFCDKIHLTVHVSSALCFMISWRWGACASRLLPKRDSELQLEFRSKHVAFVGGVPVLQ